VVFHMSGNDGVSAVATTLMLGWAASLAMSDCVAGRRRDVASIELIITMTGDDGG
jgi:hypothetical protein